MFLAFKTDKDFQIYCDIDILRANLFKIFLTILNR